MLTPETLKHVKSLCQGRIPHCVPLNEARDCAWSCCTYTDSYILLLPGEYTSAQALGYDMSAYEILDADYFGGMKVVPRSRGCCMGGSDGLTGYKPVDCAIYPLWPTIGPAGETVLIAGSLCPIVRKGLDLAAHRGRVEAVLGILRDDADVMLFLRGAQMRGYEIYRPAMAAGKGE